MAQTTEHGLITPDYTDAAAVPDVIAANNAVLEEKFAEIDENSASIAELNANNYTTAEKNKLAGIEAGAQVNTVSPADVTSAVTEAKGYTDTKLSNLVNGAPTTMDTLKELADALTENDEVVAAINAAIGSKLTTPDGGTVGQVLKKTANGYEWADDDDTTYGSATTTQAGLMSATDKTKLEGVDSGAEVNAIATVKVNGTTQTPDAQKAVDITVPTNVSDLNNDSGFQTAADVLTAIATAGQDGVRGSQWFTGTAMNGTSSSYNYTYSAANALVGDMYLNTSYGYVYQCTVAGTGTTAKWRYKGSIKGATGSPGSNGSQGASITQATQTTTSTEDGGVNEVAFYNSYGSMVGTIQVRNGSKGSTGASANTSALEAQITALSARVTALENNSGGNGGGGETPSSSATEYGIRWVTGENSLPRSDERVKRVGGTMTTGSSTGLSFSVSQDGSFNSSFLSIAPWSGMTRETISNNVMVKIPKYYIKREVANGYTYVWVCMEKLSGYRTAAIFLNADGTENDWYYTAAYNDTNARGVSQSGLAYCENNTNGSGYTTTNATSYLAPTLNMFRTAANANGTGWHLSMLAELCDLWMVLLPIEFGTRAVGDVVAGMASLHQPPTDTNYSTAHYRTGMCDSVSNLHGYYIVASNAFDYGYDYNAGQMSSTPDNYLGQTGANCGVNPFVWHGIENPYLSDGMETWYDGIVFDNNQIYVTNSITNLDNSSVYTALNYTFPSGADSRSNTESQYNPNTGMNDTVSVTYYNGYITDMAETSGAEYAYLPTAFGTLPSSPDNAPAYQMALIWDTKTNVGFAASRTTMHFLSGMPYFAAGRLAYKPQTV